MRSNPRWFVNVPGHHVSAEGWAEVVAERDGYAIVEKVGRAGELVEELEGNRDLLPETQRERAQ